MLKKIICLICLMLISTTIMFSSPIVPVYSFQKIFIFNGDKHNEFKGDLVIELNDGSCWKIHPKDKKVIVDWQKDDPLLVNVRTSKFFFKREHQFEIVNGYSNQSVRVMLVKYPCNSLTILNDETFIAGIEIIPQYIHTKKHTYIINHEVNKFEKKLTLSDGSFCILKRAETLAYYAKGEKVFIGYNTSNEKINSFIISGIEREAVAEWTALFYSHTR